MTKYPATLLGFVRRAGIWRDQSGATAIYISAMLAVSVALIGATIDFGRFNTTNTQASQAADALALAAASQLDGRADAIERATLAALTNPLVQNHQTFGASSSTVSVETLRFLHGIPADTQPITSAYETANPELARFVEVTTTAVAHSNWFIPVIGGGAGASTVGRAVAGNKQKLCRTAPLMICNPFETVSSHGFPGESVRGVQVIAKTKQNGSTAWAPGDFGLVDPANLNFDTSTNTGAKAVAEFIGSVEPQLCIDPTIELRPGTVTSMEGGINVRFDVYGNPFFGSMSAKTNPAFRPARNVIKGMITPTNACDPQTSVAAQKLPRDTCLETGTCPTGLPDRVGDGVWNRNTYWTTNHGGSLPSTLSTASRYDVYRYEIDNGVIPNKSATGGENGNPQCYAGSVPPSDNPDRRVLYLAVVNCIEQGPLTGSSNPNVKVKAFAKTFVTEPIPPDGTGSIMLEIIDVVKPGDDVLHDIVQLYR